MAANKRQLKAFNMSAMQKAQHFSLISKRSYNLLLTQTDLASTLYLTTFNYCALIRSQSYDLSDLACCART
jgi:hypothetical protein